MVDKQDSLLDCSISMSRLTLIVPTSYREQHYPCKRIQAAFWRAKYDYKPRKFNLNIRHLLQIALSSKKNRRNNNWRTRLVFEINVLSVSMGYLRWV